MKEAYGKVLGIYSTETGEWSEDIDKDVTTQSWEREYQIKFTVTISAGDQATAAAAFARGLPLAPPLPPPPK